MATSWLELSRLEKFLQGELLILLVIIYTMTFYFYRFFMRDLNFDRHRSLRTKFRSLLKSSIVMVSFFVIFEFLRQIQDSPLILHKLTLYLGLVSIIFGYISFIQFCRIFILMYFFFLSMKAAIPLLLVNIFTLILSIIIGAWIITGLLGVHVGPLLATSAAFSIILGLALQDTLGNLFAGISLQLDNVFEIGNWVEITVNGQKISGQILEISWRSLVLEGVTCEVITIPNRIVAQSQISNWTRPDSPIIKSQLFKIDYDQNVEAIKHILKECALQVTAIKKNPEPLVLISEATDSYIHMKLVYYLDNFGIQFLVADELLELCLTRLKAQNISIAQQKIQIKN